jgi:hypothetical protein
MQAKRELARFQAEAKRSNDMQAHNNQAAADQIGGLELLSRGLRQRGGTAGHQNNENGGEVC